MTLAITSVQAILLFILGLPALALLAIVTDWAGKPIRRRFEPRTRGTPAWILSHPMGSPLPGSLATTQPAAGPSPTTPPPTTPQYQPARPVPSGTLAATKRPDLPSSMHVESDEWSPGDSIYKRAEDGTSPSAAVVRRRYWRQLAQRKAASAFGADNTQRLAAGEPPLRRNPRTEVDEELALLTTDPTGRPCTPRPTWGDEGMDPFTPVASR